jgi:chemotaxis protein MotB
MRASASTGRVLVLTTLLWSAVGCVSQGVFDQAIAERDQLTIERQKLEIRVERLEAANQSYAAERIAIIDESEDLRVTQGQLQSNVVRLTRRGAELSENLESSQSMLASRNAEIAEMRGLYDGLVSDLEDEVASGQIQIEQLRSGLKMNLSQAILFSSGSAKLNQQGIEVLQKVGERLTGISNSIEVLGHTDDKPISGRYPSNWELAAARASSVVRLFAGVGVDPRKLRAVSRGEHDPVASNETAEGRATNRRIEIRLASADRSSPPAPEAGSEQAEAVSEKAESAQEVAEPAGEPAEPVSGDRPEVELPARSDEDRVVAP